MVIRKLKKLMTKKKPLPVKKKVAPPKAPIKALVKKKPAAIKPALKEEVVKEKPQVTRTMPPMPSSTAQRILTAEGWKRHLIASLQTHK